MALSFRSFALITMVASGLVLIWNPWESLARPDAPQALGKIDGMPVTLIDKAADHLRVAREKNAESLKQSLDLDLAVYVDAKSKFVNEAFAFLYYGPKKGALTECCPGLAVAVSSLRKTGTSKQILLLATDPEFQFDSVLRFYGVEVIVVPRTRGPSRCKGELLKGKERLMDSFTKIHLWNLTSFSTIVYIDQDVLILNQLDDLLKNVDNVAGGPIVGVASVGCKQCKAGDWQHMRGSGNTGLIVLQPSVQIFEKLTRLMRSSSKVWTCEEGEQRLFQVFIKNHQGNVCLPLKYNCKCSECLNYASVVHWSGERKPWASDSNIAHGAREQWHNVSALFDVEQQWRDVEHQMRQTLQVVRRAMPSFSKSDGPDWYELAHGSGG